MATSNDQLVCGCPRAGAHRPDCLLGEAERVAVTAAMTLPAEAGPRLVVALVALANAGLLREPEPEDLVEDLECLLDTLWEMGVLDRPRAGDGSR